MHSEFDAENLRSTDLSECEPGQLFWHVTRHIRSSRLNVVVKDPTNDRCGCGIATVGDDFQILRGFPLPGTTTVLAVPMEPFAVKLPNPISTAAPTDTPGELVLSSEAAFIALAGEDRNGFRETRFLSLADWSLHEHVPNRSANFHVWQLVTKPTPERQSRVVINKSE